MTMEKILFNSKKELLEWLYTGYIKLGAFKDYHVTNLAHDMGVYFYTKIEAGLTEVDDGSFAGAEHYSINKNGYFPKKFPTVLVLHKTINHKENQYDYYFEFVYLKDFEKKTKK